MTKRRFGCSCASTLLGVIEAVDGPTGVALAKEERPDVILLNVNLPGLAGWQVAEALVGGKETREIPIVFLTAGCVQRSRPWVRSWRLQQRTGRTTIRKTTVFSTDYAYSGKRSQPVAIGRKSDCTANPLAKAKLLPSVA